MSAKGSNVKQARGAKSGRFIEEVPGKGRWMLRDGNSGKVIEVSPKSSRVIKNAAAKYHSVLESLSKR